MRPKDHCVCAILFRFSAGRVLHVVSVFYRVLTVAEIGVVLFYSGAVLPTVARRI